MPLTLSILLEESVQIAWEYLEATGEIEDAMEAGRFLTDVVEAMIRHGNRSRLLLSNRAIAAYQKRNLGVKEETYSRVWDQRPRWP